MKPRESNAGPPVGGEENYRADSVTEMRAFESLPRRLQLAITWSALKVSAAQAVEMIEAGKFTADQLAAGIEADTFNRQKGPIVCRPKGRLSARKRASP